MFLFKIGPENFDTFPLIIIFNSVKSLVFLTSNNGEKYFITIKYIPGGAPTVGILRFNTRAEKWEDVGRFQRYGFAMQAGFSDFNILCRNQPNFNYFIVYFILIFPLNYRIPWQPINPSLFRWWTTLRSTVAKSTKQPARYSMN